MSIGPHGGRALGIVHATRTTQYLREGDSTHDGEERVYAVGSSTGIEYNEGYRHGKYRSNSADNLVQLHRLVVKTLVSLRVERNIPVL